MVGGAFLYSWTGSSIWVPGFAGKVGNVAVTEICTAELELPGETKPFKFVSTHESDFDFNRVYRFGYGPDSNHVFHTAIIIVTGVVFIKR